MGKRVMDNKKLIIGMAAAVLLLAVNFIGIVSSGSNEFGGSLVKNLALAFFYILYLGLGRWINPGILLFAAVAFFRGIKKESVNRKEWAVFSFCGVMVFYLSLLFWVSAMGGLADIAAEYLLQAEYYVFFLYQAYMLGRHMKVCSLENAGRRAKDGSTVEEGRFFGRLSWGLWGIFFLSLIPVLGIAPYIFPQADDWTFGARAHIALEETGSVVEVLKAICSRIQDTYFQHQGTFTSLFMMCIQPAVFEESWYGITPFFFVGVITLSTWFFFREILQKWLGMGRGLCLSLVALYSLFIIQCMPSKASAFYWYNGAVHYILPHSILLCMLAFVLRLYLGKRTVYNYLGAGLTAFYIGGSNLVTGVECIILLGGICLLITLSKQWKQQKGLLIPGLSFAAAFLVNVAAPGNYVRMGYSQGGGLVESFFKAFEMSLEYMLGEWVHWSLCWFIVLIIPILWRISGKINYSWPCPLLVLLFGWGCVAGMFFAPLFSAGDVSAGRYLNVMYMTWLLWLMVDITYILGWIRRKYQIEGLREKPLNYYGLVFGIGAVCFIPGVIAEPEHYTASYAARTMLNGEAHAYARVYGKNIEILKNSSEDEVTIYELENEPLIFTGPDIETWQSGIRLFYQKEKINYIPWEEN